MSKYFPPYCNVEDIVQIIDKVFKLDQQIQELMLQREQCNKALLEKIGHKDVYTMSENELYEHCRAHGLSDADCKIAFFIIHERLKGKELYDAIGYSERQAKRKRAVILNIIK